MLLPFKKAVDRFVNSSKIPSFSYPAVLIDRIKGCRRAPSADFITSYCFNPPSPRQLATSSLTTKCGLKPSDFFALKASGFITVFASSM